MERKNWTQPHPGIRIDKIPVSGREGLLFTAAAMVCFLAVPEVRGFGLLAVLGALPVAASLYFWRNQTRW
jgi:hypothetical protein